MERRTIRKWFRLMTNCTATQNMVNQYSSLVLCFLDLFPIFLVVGELKMIFMRGIKFVHTR
jgi:hypothetical protein